MSFISININYTGVTNSFTPAVLPAQKTYINNQSNPLYWRNFTLQSDCLIYSIYTSSVIIPISQLNLACVSASAVLSYPPYFISQPTGSQTVTHPNSASWFISASAETPITYQWASSSYSQSYSASTFISYSWKSIPSNAIYYTGSTTNYMTHSNTSIAGDTSSSYICYISNTSGATTSSVSPLFVL